MHLRNEDIRELIAEIPDGHTHLRITLILHNGTEITFNEATAANFVRAYVSVKTHPLKTRARLVGRRIPGLKNGYADWQLIEEEDRE
jgi:hypothetical protein